MSFYPSSPDSSSGSSFESSFPSRPQSTSPSLQGVYPHVSKLRQEACRGFDLEDDQEFCPALVAYQPYPNYPQMSSYPAYAPNAASPTSSPPGAKSTPLSPATATFQAAGGRRKPIDIIDPSTGLRVSRR